MQHVIIRLADSLPANVVAAMEAELSALPESERGRTRRERIEQILDAGHGSGLLRREACAEVVASALRFGDGARYRLLAWVVMPNHLHVLIEQLPEWTLASVVQGLKRHTTREIQRIVGGAGQLWQREYWDRFIRDERHYRRVVDYIHANPVQAGLVTRPEDWRWSSASESEQSGHTSPRRTSD